MSRRLHPRVVIARELDELEKHLDAVARNKSTRGHRAPMHRIARRVKEIAEGITYWHPFTPSKTDWVRGAIAHLRRAVEDERDVEGATKAAVLFAYVKRLCQCK